MAACGLQEMSAGSRRADGSATSITLSVFSRAREEPVIKWWRRSWSGAGAATGTLLIDSAIVRTRVSRGPRSMHCLRFSCARARPRGRRFRSGGAGIELWGSFGARRSKPLAAAVCGVCVLWHFRPARRCSLFLGVRAPGRRAANEEKQGDCYAIVLAQAFNEESDSKRTSKRRQFQTPVATG